MQWSPTLPMGTAWEGGEGRELDARVCVCGVCVGGRGGGGGVGRVSIATRLVEGRVLRCAESFI